jgi:hypothetical protein
MSGTIEVARIRWLRAALWAAAVILSAPLVVPLLTGRVFTHDDLRTFHLPLRYLYQQALQAGDSTLWTPSVFSGLYLLGEGQAGTLHPWHWAIYRWLPLDVAFNLELLFSYVAGGAGTFVLLRRIPLHAESAVFGALVAAFSGFNLLHAMHLNTIAVLAHLPWVLVGTDCLIAARTRKEVAIGTGAVAVLVASEWLLGFPQAVYFTALTAVAFAIVRAWRAGRLDRIFAFAAAFAAGTLAGAVQWMPMAYAAEHSYRSAPDVSFLLSYSLHPFNLAQFAAPYALQGRVYGPPASPMHEYGIYAGALAPVSLAWVLVRWPRIGHRVVAAGCVALTLVALVLALGKYTPVLPLLVSLPGYPPFRAPTRHIVIAHLALAVLAAMLIEDLTRNGAAKDGGEAGRAWILLAPFACGVAGVFVTHLFPQITPAPWGVALAGTLPVLAAAALVWAAARGARFAPAALVVLVALDLAAWGYPPLWRSPVMSIAEIAKEADAPTRAATGTYIRANTAYGNVAVLRGVRLSNGYVALHPRRELLDNTTPAMRLAGVRWTTDGSRWVAVDDPMPRARLVADTLVPSDPRAAVRTIDIARVALVDAAVPSLSGDPGTAVLVEDRPGRLVIDTTAPGRQLLVTTERFEEGWTAKEGCAETARRVNADFLGCVVSEGSRRVVFEFDPPSYRRGRQLAAAGVAAMLVLMWIVPLRNPFSGGRDRAD